MSAPALSDRTLLENALLRIETLTRELLADKANLPSREWPKLESIADQLRLLDSLRAGIRARRLSGELPMGWDS